MSSSRQNRRRTSSTGSQNRQNVTREGDLTKNDQENTEKWLTTSNVVEQYIPEYDATVDKHCTRNITTRGGSRINSPIKKKESGSRSRQKSRHARTSVGIPRKCPDIDTRNTNRPTTTLAKPTLFNPNSTSMRDSKSKEKSNIPIGVSNMSTRTGGITFQDKNPENDGSSIELDALKSILLRENYLNKLLNYCKMEVNHSNLAQVVDILDLLRPITLEVVELIQKWKNCQAESKPFLWNGIDYVLKIPSDMDYLDEIAYLSSWLGFSMHRNPFILPGNLDTRMSLNDSTTLSEANWQFKTSSSFFSVGGGIRNTDNESQQNLCNLKSNIQVNRSNPKTPYNTPIINNTNFVPSSSQPINRVSSSRSVSRTSSRQEKKENLKTLPSQVGNIDILRIQNAETFLLMEEERRGKYKRDPSGRLVTELEANRLHKQDQISKKNIKNNLLEDDDDTDVLSNAMAISGNQKAYKNGGSLAPISKSATTGRRVSPIKRSRGARMEEDIKRAKFHNNCLEEEINELREKIKERESTLMSLENNSQEFSIYEFAIDKEEQHRRKQSKLNHKLQLDKMIKDMDEKENYLSIRKVEIQRKEDAIETFKIEQKKKVDDKRENELNNGAVGVSTTLEASSIENQAACEIQKIVRGRQDGAYVRKLRIEYAISSVFIQSSVRGFLARRRIRKIFRRNISALLIQKYLRGMKARVAFAKKKQMLFLNSHATRMQSFLRGFRGRKRMKSKMLLQANSTDIQDSISSIYASDLKELGEKCISANPSNSPPSIILSLLHLLYELTKYPNETETEQSHVNVQFQWKTAGKFLRRSKKIIRRMTYIASIAGKRSLYLSTSARSYSLAYQREPKFHMQTFQRYSPIALLIYKWIISFLKCISLQDQFFSDELSPHSYEECEEDIENDSLEDAICELEEKQLEKQYLPLEYIYHFPNRPRPIIFLLARDIPAISKKKIVHKIQSSLPGLFIHVESRCEQPKTHEYGKQKLQKEKRWEDLGFSLNEVQRIFDVNHSVIVDVDIGLRELQRQLFLHQFQLIKAALHPTPLCVLLQGSHQNRSGTGLNIDEYGVHAEDLDMMRDSDVKQKLQTISESLHKMNCSHIQLEMAQLSRQTDPVPELVLVLEAALVILSPNQRFAGPSATASTISWRIGSRLLEQPQLFVSKLKEIDYAKIPEENLQALSLYIMHSSWPSPSVRRSNNDNALFYLAEWSQSVAEFGILLVKEGGLADQITRRNPAGLFAGVVNVVDEAGRDFMSSSSQIVEKKAAWRVAAEGLISVMLEDMKVYKEILRIEQPISRQRKYFPGKFLILNVMKSNSHIFIHGYSPGDCQTFMHILHESKLNELLAPNSIEKHSRSNACSPPTSYKEMYSRLIRLCFLREERLEEEFMKDSTTGKVLDKKKTLELVACRTQHRLVRETRKIGGHFAIITISELSRKQLFLQAFLSGFQTQEQYLYKTLYEKDIDELSDSVECPLEKKIYISNDVSVVSQYIFDRITITQGKNSCDISQPFYRMQIRKFGNPGRLLFHYTKKKRINDKCCLVFIISVYLLKSGDLRAEVYEQSKSQKAHVIISFREKKDILYSASLQMSWKTALYQRLRICCSIESNKTTVKFCRLLFRKMTKLLCWKDPIKNYTNDPISILVQVMHGGQNGGIKYRFYDPVSSKEYDVILSDDNVKRVLRICNGENHPVWPTRTFEMFKKVATLIIQKFRFLYEKDCLFLECINLITASCGSSKPMQPPPTTENAPSEDSADTFKSALLVEDSNNIKKNCIQLLDFTDPPEVSSSLEHNQNEMVHSGSYRSNGTLIVTQIFMKAVLQEKMLSRNGTLEPFTETQCTDFEMQFIVYNPQLSLKGSAVIYGMVDLKQVAGPKHIELISSSSILRLLRHIITARMEFEVDEENNDVLKVEFLRDRMYADLKVTPVNMSMLEDEAANCNRLFEHKKFRGVKILSRVITICDKKWIVSVFDLSETTSQVSLRFTAYNRDTSKQVSLIAAHNKVIELVGASTSLLDYSKRKDLAAYLLNYLHMEPLNNNDEFDLIFTADTNKDMVQTSSSLHQKIKNRSDWKLLFKCGRALAGSKIVCSVYLGLLQDKNLEKSEELYIQIYDPVTSVSEYIVVSELQLELLVGNGDCLKKILSTPSILRSAMSTLCEFVQVKKIINEMGDFQLKLTFMFDENRAKAALQSHKDKEKTETLRMEKIDVNNILSQQQQNKEEKIQWDEKGSKEENFKVESIAHVASVVGYKYCFVTISKQTDELDELVGFIYSIYCPVAYQATTFACTLETLQSLYMYEGVTVDYSNLGEFAQQLLPVLELRNAFDPTLLNGNAKMEVFLSKRAQQFQTTN